jgi:hypothetical protein
VKYPKKVITCVSGKKTDIHPMSWTTGEAVFMRWTFAAPDFFAVSTDAEILIKIRRG